MACKLCRLSHKLNQTKSHGHCSEGVKAAMPYISMVKIVGPNMAQAVADRAMQVFGGMGVSQDTLIPDVFLHGRIARIADGPDEVHMSQLAKLTLREMAS